MKWLNRLFGKKKETQVLQPYPSWDTVVEVMQNKQLNRGDDEVINVLSSKDRTMRYVILKDKQGILTYQLEALYQFDEDEWQYIGYDPDRLPGMWESHISQRGGSLFSREEDLMNQLTCEFEYKEYFI